MNLLKLGNPDEDVACPNEKCKASYQWDYNGLQFILIDGHQDTSTERAALVREYTRVVDSEDWEDQDQIHYCVQCKHMIAISYTTDFLAGQSHMYIPTKE